MSRRLWLQHRLVDLAWGRTNGRDTARHRPGAGACFADPPIATDTHDGPATAATGPGGTASIGEGAGAGNRAPMALF